MRKRHWNCFGWGWALVPTDIPNPDEPGEPLYVWAKVRPRWYWWWKRLRLFLSIVWRDAYGERMSAGTAWAVAKIIHGNGITASRFKEAP